MQYSYLTRERSTLQGRNTDHLINKTLDETHYHYVIEVEKKLNTLI